MGRHVSNSTTDGIICIDNVELIKGDKGNIIVLRCMHCNKFVSKNIDKFYCPHCEGTFINGLSIEDFKSTENLLNYLEDIKDIMTNE